ncbi:MAG: hypothetical protein RLZZ311_852 [Actinomycetota bacterium]
MLAPYLLGTNPLHNFLEKFSRGEVSKKLHSVEVNALQRSRG